MEVALMINGEEKFFSTETTYREIAELYQPKYSDDIMLVKHDHNLQELYRTPTRSGKLEFITTADKVGRNTYRRSLILLMEAAAYKMFPELCLLVKHSIGQGLYCEFHNPDLSIMPVTEEILAQLKGIMMDYVERDMPICKETIRREDALYEFRKRRQMDKVKLMRFRRNSNTNLYCMDGYLDYYYGYMAPSAGKLGVFDLISYQNGFMLMLPGKDTKKVAEFKPLDKLFDVIDTSTRWGEEIGVYDIGGLNDTIAKGNVLDLILMQEAYMEHQLGEIAERIAKENKKIILIAGPSSSGKTTFSHRLSVQLRANGLKPHPIAMDDFYVNREDTPKDENGEYDFECIEALDIPLFNQCMNDLLQGKEVLLPVFNFKTGHREFRNRGLTLEPDGVLVIEGIHGLNDRLSADLPAESKFKIYISALTQLNIDAHNNLPTTDGRLIRRMVRDNRTRNTTARETIARWDSVRRGEEKNIFPFQEEADVMFNSALIYEFSVLKLYAEPLLFAIPEECPEYIEAKRLIKFLDYFLPVPSENIGVNSVLREFIGGSVFNV